MNPSKSSKRVRTVSEDTPARRQLAHFSSSHKRLDKQAAPPTAVSFEGPEKTLEVDLVPRRGPGLRSIPVVFWDELLEHANARILSKIENEHVVAYLLSESSLFVYDWKMLLKTCGTTTLLKTLPVFLKYIRSEGMEMEWLGYSRKEFTNPTAQEYPHTSFGEEVAFASKCRAPPPHHDKRLEGGAYVLGDLTSDHWYLYVSDYCERPVSESIERNINIMMYGLDPSVSKFFIFDVDSELDEAAQGAKATERSGIATIMAQFQGTSKIDTYMFKPMGYSMNALVGQAFFTIHVTPEKHQSYASFETNVRVENYTQTIEDVLRVFRPQKFTQTIFGDSAGYAEMKPVPSTVKRVLQYVRTTQSRTLFKTDFECSVASYSAGTQA